MDPRTEPAANQGTEPLEAATVAIRNRWGGLRGALAVALLEQIWSRSPTTHLWHQSPTDMAAHVGSLLDFLDGPLDRVRVRARGVAWRQESCVTCLESVALDQPFIVDSLRELARVQGLDILGFLHPILSVERDPTGAILHLGPPRPGTELVSVVSLELAQCLGDSERSGLATEAAEVLEEAQEVVHHFEPMRLTLQEAIAALEAHEGSSDEEAFQEGIAFLHWLEQSNFVFLGCRTYRFEGSGTEATLQMVPDSGLGLLREESRSCYEHPRLLSTLPPDLRESLLDAHTPVLIQKTKAESPVLRRTRMDSIGVKILDKERCVRGEYRFLGLFTARAYNDVPSDIPIVRKKFERILTDRNVVPGSHDHNALFSIFSSLPKSELFAMQATEIEERILGILASSGSRDVRVLYREDLLERGVSVMVLVPRERLNSAVRMSIQDRLEQLFEGTTIDLQLSITEEPLSRLHFYLETPQAKPVLPSTALLEKEVTEITRTWGDRLREGLEVAFGTEPGRSLWERYSEAFPANYQAERTPEEALSDLHEIEAVLQTADLRVRVSSAETGGQRACSALCIYHRGEPLGLSRLMPVLTHLGLEVLDERTYEVTAERPAPDRRAGTRPLAVFQHAFRVVCAGEPIRSRSTSTHVAEAVCKVLEGAADDDPMNTLIPLTGMSWRQASVLRAYYAYLRQVRVPWRQRTIYTTLIENHRASKLLVDLFEARFNPGIEPETSGGSEEDVRLAFSALLQEVEGITEDQILRSFENAIESTVRTNYSRDPGVSSGARPLALKIRSDQIHSMPAPRPHSEIFVCGPQVEGIHLRSGKVARGGIRWSSRLDDFRMEILGLMKAQRTKNALIVPVGAKGGFVVKKPGPPSTFSPTQEEVRQRYETYIEALLEVTDNIIDDRVVHPDGVVVLDEDDPYLVVAADRGTATFSDIANSIAESSRFWLGDAFASGGSTGYDHKKEGITARGAWECVCRHFRELDIDLNTKTFTVAGIGDMSGDVFGNGMLLSKNIRLVAAFNHLHVFLDPNPDADSSYEERQRLFQLPRSSWMDYDTAVISPGGGVFRRDAKSISLSEEARERLGIEESVLNGEQLVRVVLCMPVDLLWNGGIGTYVSAASETSQDVGDPANDSVRVQGGDLRARVVGEGGNLGFTQIGRIEYARAGGRINTDFIDNSGGVDISDHEVNLKILLAPELNAGTITRKERDVILQKVTPEICRGVLRHNSCQSLCISLEERRAKTLLDEHRFLIDELCQRGMLDRSVEKLPREEDFSRLRGSGSGLTRPQLAVLLAYSKIDAYARVLASLLPDGGELQTFLFSYFPKVVAVNYPTAVRDHRLRREIAATEAVNLAINVMGITFFHRLSRLHDEPFDVILKAFLVAWELSEGSLFHLQLEDLYENDFVIEPMYDGLTRFASAVEEVLAAILPRGFEHTTADSVRELTSLLEYLPPEDSSSKRVERAETVAADFEASSLPPSSLEMLEGATSLAENLDLASLVRETRIDGAQGRALWHRAGEALWLSTIEQEAARIQCTSADDMQTRTTLLGELRRLRRTIARRAMLRKAEGLLKESDFTQWFPPQHARIVHVRKILETAKTREPITLSNLFVIASSLQRMVNQPG